MRIAIVGLGVIGGSFAYALRDAGYTQVFGIDTDAEAIDKAVKMGIIAGGGDCAQILPEADIVILAIYPGQVRDFLSANMALFKSGAIVTDVTGIKSALCAREEGFLRADIDFIPGHPMAGREKQGIDYASVEIFRGANYLITPMPDNKPENIETLEALIRQLGFGRIRRIDAGAHDERIAYTSQLPHALAVALINSDAEDSDTAVFTGDSYRELTRIANINAPLWTELFLGNRAFLLEAMDAFEREFDLIREAVDAQDAQTLIQCFEKSSRRRIALEAADGRMKS